MKRRQILKQISFLLAGGVCSPTLLNASTAHKLSFTFDASIVVLLGEIAETIIPTTITPGAKTAKAHEFALRIIENCYTKSEKNRFFEELSNFNLTCISKLNKNFVDLNAIQKTGMLKELTVLNPKFFKEMKQLIAVGYFTSAEGATKALAYEPIPGKYEGCIPLKNGQKAWAI